MSILFSQSNETNDQSDPRQIDALRAITYCPWCEKRFHHLQVHVIAEQANHQLLHFQCQECSSYVLVAVSINGTVVSSLGLISDLGREDIRRLLGLPQLQEDDVLQLHGLLNGSPQQIARLFVGQTRQ